MQLHWFKLKIPSLILIVCTRCFIANAQVCPPNIDFETGTFDGWQCYTGRAEVVNASNVIDLTRSTGPVANRHTMYTANTGNNVDPYGGFPVNCPNGSGHSIRLGNNQAGTEAEGISYEFTIPPDQDIYSLIYHYAVVFQDPNHEAYQQPRLVIEITNVTDNKLIECSSFTFIPYGTLLPGFFESPNPAGGTPVWWKDWSAVSINLDGNAGKKIRLFFKTADCTFRRHFGYAYIDVNSECSSEFVGSTYCDDDSAVNLTAPFGYQGYKWFDSTFTKVLGTQQTISFKPPPPPGTSFAVSVIPYDGYGCVDTLYARLENSLTVKSYAGKDTLSCNLSAVAIGGNARPGLVYTWRPATGLSNPNVANPLAAPAATTSYVLTTNHDGGGCVNEDTVVVVTSVIDSSLLLTGSAMYCSDSGDSAVLRVPPTTSIQWYSDDGPLNAANQTSYRVRQSGSYYAMLMNNDGCIISTKRQEIVIDDPVPGIRYPDEYAAVDLPLDLKARQLGDVVFWIPGTFLSTQDSYTPVFIGQDEQLYTVHITTNSGCTTIDTQLVKAAGKVEINVPTAFSPNSDGLNDILRPILFGIKELHYFRIFNRVGELLYETKTPRAGWDGRQKGIPMTSQVVVWVAEALGADNKTYLRRGSSMLVR